MSRTYGMTEWREDIKTVIKKAGLGEQHVVFLFADTQVCLIIVILFKLFNF